MTESPKRTRELLKRIRSAGGKIGRAALKDRAIFDEIIYPLLVLYNSTEELLRLAGETEPEWQDTIGRFTRKGGTKP